MTLRPDRLKPATRNRTSFPGALPGTAIPPGARVVSSALGEGRFALTLDPEPADAALPMALMRLRRWH